MLQTRRTQMKAKLREMLTKKKRKTERAVQTKWLLFVNRVFKAFQNSFRSVSLILNGPRGPGLVGFT